MAAGYYTSTPGRLVGYQVLATLGSADFSFWWAFADVNPLLTVLRDVIAACW